jgi:hypothetical protein
MSTSRPMLLAEAVAARIAASAILAGEAGAAIAARLITPKLVIRNLGATVTVDCAPTGRKSALESRAGAGETIVVDVTLCARAATDPRADELMALVDAIIDDLERRSYTLDLGSGSSPVYQWQAAENDPPYEAEILDLHRVLLSTISLTYRRHA